MNLSILHLSISVLTYAVMVHSPFIAQRYWHLTRTAFTFPHQEATIDARAKQVLGGIPRHWAMIPGKFIQAVHWSYVIAWYPSQFASFGSYFSPFFGLIIPQNSYLVACKWKVNALNSIATIQYNRHYHFVKSICLLFLFFLVSKTMRTSCVAGVLMNRVQEFLAFSIKINKKTQEKD